MRKRRFISNVLVMTSSMLIVRIMGMTSNIYISSLAGSASMGLYQMIFSVFTFGITFSSSGTGFTATRLISEDTGDERNIVRKCLFIALVMSSLAFCFFFFASSFVGSYLIRNTESISAVRAMSFCLPCMALSSVIRGYYIAKRRAGIMTASSILEEALSIGSTLFLIKFTTLKSHLCLVMGLVISNAFAFVFDFATYTICSKHSKRKNKNISYKNIFAICIPIALGSYLRTFLATTENLLVPIQFQKFGITEPISEYGLIKGMVMPLVLFPTVFIQAFSSMLVPELSEMNSLKRPNGIRHVSALALNTTTMFGFFISLMLFSHHDIIGRTFYKEERISYYLGMLSLLAVPLYLDTVADCILKGLDLQNACLKYNIIDSILRLFCVFMIMPRYGPLFYVAMLYLSEIFNLFLSLRKAARATGLKIDFANLFLRPLVSVVFAWFFKPPLMQTLVYISIYMCLGTLLKKNKEKGFKGQTPFKAHI